MGNLGMMVLRQAQLNNKVAGLNWRSRREYRIRHTIAWIFNLGVVIAFCFVSVVYGLKFGEQSTKNMILSWLIAYGVTAAIVEPIQILVVVCFPCLCDESTRCGRYMRKCQFVYNELCAP